MKLTILGNNSALPAYDRHPTSQVVTIGGEDIMLDCGEGTQMQMQRYGIKWAKINHIFISHLHGDHYFGLPGLITTMSLQQRTAPLHVYGPPQLKDMIDAMLSVSGTQIFYPFHYHHLEANTGYELLADTKTFTVHCFPVEHRIGCHGFLITNKTKGRKLLPEKCREYEIPAYYYDKLKQGADYERANGELIKNEWLTAEGPDAKKYAYCADTLFTESFLPYIKNADAIYHETTYLEADMEKATLRYHSTARQAAQIAKLAGAKKLLIGHFSSRYKDLEPFLTEASAVFTNTIITYEGTTYEI